MRTPLARIHRPPAATRCLAHAVCLLAIAAAPAAAGEFKVRGFVHYDARHFDERVSATTGESSELRRVRPTFEYKAEGWSARFTPDLQRETNQALDAYLEFTPDAPWDLRIGRFKSPISLDRLRPSNAIGLTENSLVAEMTPSYDNGILLGLQGDGESFWRGEIAAFDGAADGEVKGSLDGGQEWTLRVLRTQATAAGTWRAGVAGSRGDRDGGIDDPRIARYRTPGRSTWFRYASGAYSDGTASRVAAFADYHGGPWFAQAEVIRSSETVRQGLAEARLSHAGWDLQGSRVLTGEDRTPAGVTPGNLVLPLLGVPVAVELSAHVAGARIDDDAFALGLAGAGGNGERLRQAGVAIGLWFPKQWRLTFAYEDTRIEVADGGADLRERVVLGRFALTF